MRVLVTLPTDTSTSGDDAKKRSDSTANGDEVNKNNAFVAGDRVRCTQTNNAVIYRLALQTGEYIQPCNS